MELFEILEKAKDFQPEMLDIGEGVRVKPYLPYQEKIDFATDVFRNVARIDEETGLFYTAYNEDYFVVLGQLKYYAGINTDGAEEETAVAIYDYAKSSGLMSSIMLAVSEDVSVSLTMYEQMKSSVLNINRQSLSVGHQMGKMMDMADSPEFTAALTNAKLQSENMANQMKVLDNSTSSSTRPFMNFAKK